MPLYTYPYKSIESASAKEIRKLNQMLKEKDKEIEFLKKQWHSLQKKSISGISFY